MVAKKKKDKKALSSFSILFIIIFVLAIITWVVAGNTFAPTVPPGGTETVDHVIGARISDIIMSPFNGFRDAIDICVFILVLGGFLNIVTETGALEAGIQHVVKKLKGNELIIIPILMLLFSIGGSTYGMAEETIPFYILITATLVASGFDTIVAVGTILLGTSAGIIGSTVNPFSTGVAMDALKGIDIDVNTGLTLLIGAVIWATTTLFSIMYMMSYAKKVKADKGSTILSLQEQDIMMSEFGEETKEEVVFTKKHKLVLSVFALCFIVMILSLIPWSTFGVTLFEGWTSVITGENFGDWYFGDLSMWFFLMGIIIAVINRFSESEIIDIFLAGAKDLISVVMIIVVARGASVLMSQTHLDLYILDKAAGGLSHLSPILFVIMSYILYLALSFLIPSTSGLAYVSIPVMGGLAHSIGLSPEVMIMIFVSGCGLINIITPTSGVVMGGLEAAKINYSTWLKFIIKPMIIISLMNLIVLVISMLLVT